MPSPGSFPAVVNRPSSELKTDLAASCSFASPCILLKKLPDSWQRQRVARSRDFGRENVTGSVLSDFFLSRRVTALCLCFNNIISS